MPRHRNKPATFSRSSLLSLKTNRLRSSPRARRPLFYSRKTANIAAGLKEPNKTKVGKVTRKQVMDIVNTKRKDLNAQDDEADFRIIAGTARQMGLEVVD